MMGAANGLFARLPEVTVARAGGVRRPTPTSIPPDLARRLADRMPHATLEVWDGRGHFGPIEDPDRAVDSMLRFAIAPHPGTRI